MLWCPEIYYHYFCLCNFYIYNRWSSGLTRLEIQSHVMECDYRRVLDWWSDLLNSLIQRVTTLSSSVLHTHALVFIVFTSRCSVAASNGRRSPSSGFPNCPWPQLPASHSNSSQWPDLSSSPTNSLTDLVTHQSNHSTLLNRLTLTVLLITPLHGPYRKHSSSVVVYGPLHNKSRFIFVCFTAVA
jgi:hypothetical protein